MTEAEYDRFLILLHKLVHEKYTPYEKKQKLFREINKAGDTYAVALEEFLNWFDEDDFP